VSGKIFIFLIAIVLVITVPLYLFLESTFEIPGNDVWIRNTNQIIVDGVAMGETGDEIHFNSYTIPSEICIQTFLQMSFNETLGNTYFISIEYDISAQRSDFSFNIQTIQGYFEREHKFLIQVNWTNPLLVTEYTAQYLITIEQVMFSIGNTTFYLAQARQIHGEIRIIMDEYSVEAFIDIMPVGEQDLILGTIDNSVNDTDLDGLPDDVEVNLGTDPNNPDTDRDGLLDSEEVEQVTDPLKWDTDGDGYSDYVELYIWNTDPVNGESYPKPSSIGKSSSDWVFIICISLPIISPPGASIIHEEAILMPKKRIDKKSERIVKKKGKADIIKAHPRSNTIEVRTRDKKGTNSKRTYSLSIKHGLSPKREKRRTKK